MATTKKGDMSEPPQRSHGRRRRLTDRQIRALAVLERHGQAKNILELRQDFPGLNASEITRTLYSLVERGLVECDGDRDLIYVGGFYFWPRGRSPFEPGLSQLAAELEHAVPLKVFCVVGESAVTVQLPLTEILRDLLDGADAGSAIEALRLALTSLLDDGRVAEVMMERRLQVAGPVPALAIKVLPTTVGRQRRRP